MSYNADSGLYEGYIYLIENSINRRRYIGQTTITIQDRFSKHLKDATCGVDTYLYRAMRLFGIENFSVSEITKVFAETKEALVERLNDLERFYINELSTLSPNGYNLTKGGRAFAKQMSRPVFMTDSDGNVLGIYESIREAANSNGFDEKTISHGYGSTTHFSSGYFWFPHDGSVKVGDNIGPQTRGVHNWVGHTTYVGKPVDMFSIDGEYITTYESASIASRELNINRGNISACCCGSQKSAGGYRWAYSNL